MLSDEKQKLLSKIVQDHESAKLKRKQEKEAARIEAEFEKSTLAQDRIAICKSCDLYNQTLRMCSDCKCFMPVKTMLKWSKCPQNKW